MIKGSIITLEIDTNGLRDGRVSTYLMEDERDYLLFLAPGKLVRARSEEGHEYLARVDEVRGNVVYLTLLEAWLTVSGAFVVEQAA